MCSALFPENADSPSGMEAAREEGGFWSSSSSAGGGGLPEVIGLSLLSALIYFIGGRLYALQKRGSLCLPGPPALPVLGNLHTLGGMLAKNGRHLYKVHLEWRRVFGKVYGFFIGPRLFVVFENLDDVHNVLVKQFANFVDRQPMDFLHESLKEALVNQRGDRWRQMRARVSPAFTNRKLRMMEPSMQEKISILCDGLESAAHTGEDVDIYSAYQRLTLDVIASIAFGLRTRCQADASDAFLLHSRRFFAEMPDPERCPAMAIALLFPELAHICEFAHRKLSAAAAPEQWLARQLRAVVQRRMREHEDHADIIGMLLSSASPSDSADDILDSVVANAFAFLLAGYETTSTSLAFATWLLAKNPACQQTLADELEEAREEMDSDSCWFDIVMRLPYLNGVFKETLRLYPPITFFVNRTCISSCRVGSVEMPRGVVACVPVWNIHRDPENWPRPDEFIPERFIFAPPRHPMSWLPFGGGPRNCVGARFAELEFKATLARVIAAFRVELADDCQKLVLLNPSVMLAPERVAVRVQRRDPEGIL